MFSEESARANAFIEEMNRQEVGLLYQEAKTEKEISDLADLISVGDVVEINTLLSLRLFEIIRPLRFLSTFREDSLYVAFGKKFFDVTIYLMGADILSPEIDLPKEGDLKEEHNWGRIIQKDPKLSIDDIIKKRIIASLMTINRIDGYLKRMIVPYQEAILSKDGRAIHKGFSFVAWIESKRLIQQEKHLRTHGAPPYLMEECERKIERITNIIRILEQGKFW